jgi:protein-tyrosine-phosphatase
MAHSKPNKITVICTANICRSPLGERLLALALQNEEGPLCQLTVVSAGVAASPGHPASSFSVDILKNEGIDLSGHCSQPLTQTLVDESLFILGMTDSHSDIIEAIFKTRKGQVRLFREFVGSGKTPEIPDPFGGSLTLYKETLDSVKEAIPSLIDFIRKHA